MQQSLYWKSLPLENHTGAEVFAALFGKAKIATLLESPLPIKGDRTPLAQYSICAGSPRLVDGCLQSWTPPIGKIFPFLEQLLEQVSGEKNLNYCPNELPFTGGWLGWLGYDAAWEIEKLPWKRADNLPFPVAFWYQPESFAVLDHLQQLLWLAAADISQLDTLTNQLKLAPTPPSPFSPRTSPVRFLTSQSDYEAAVRQAKKYIQAGDIFQTNLSVRFSTQTSSDSWEIYRTFSSRGARISSNRRPTNLFSTTTDTDPGPKTAAKRRLCIRIQRLCQRRASALVCRASCAGRNPSTW